MLKEVLVVEGRNDTTAVQRAVEADTIETGGSAVSPAVLTQIALAQQRRGVIILTDPDYAGERIRRIVSKAVPGCYHAFLPREKATKKGEVGVEHASPDAIRAALSGFRREEPPLQDHVAWQDWLEMGFVNGPNAKAKRIRLGEILGIGYGNGRQMYKKLQSFQITAEELGRALEVMQLGQSDWDA